MEAPVMPVRPKSASVVGATSAPDPRRPVSAPRGRSLRLSQVPDPAPPWVRYRGFEGNLIGGQRHGQGAYRYRNPFFRYNGGWVWNQKQGHGVMTLGDGTHYTGEWIGGEMTGKGSKCWSDGSTFDGTFVNGEPHGEGVFIGAAGERYLGGWWQGRRQGHGVLRTSAGDRYEGGFRWHQFDGVGKLTCHDGTVFEGRWSGGLLGHAHERQLLTSLWTKAKGSWRAVMCDVTDYLSALQRDSELMRALRINSCSVHAAIALRELRNAIAAGDDTAASRVLERRPSLGDSVDAEGAGPLTWVCETAPRSSAVVLADLLLFHGAARREKADAASAARASGRPVKLAADAAAARDDGAAAELQSLLRDRGCVTSDQLTAAQDCEDPPAAHWCDGFLEALGGHWGDSGLTRNAVTLETLEGILSATAPAGLEDSVRIKLATGGGYTGGMAGLMRHGRGKQVWPGQQLVFDGEWERDRPKKPATKLSLEELTNDGRSAQSFSTSSSFPVRPSAAPILIRCATVRPASPPAPGSKEEEEAEAAAAAAEAAAAAAAAAAAGKKAGKKEQQAAAALAESAAAARQQQTFRTVTEASGRRFSAVLHRPPPPPSEGGKKGGSAMQLPLLLDAIPDDSQRLALASEGVWRRSPRGQASPTVKAGGKRDPKRRQSHSRQSLKRGSSAMKPAEAPPDAFENSGAIELPVWLPPGLDPGVYLLEVSDTTPWPTPAAFLAAPRDGAGEGPVHRNRSLRGIPPPLPPLQPLVLSIEVSGK
eukprot:TRINITY_DN24213_c0_g1_i1.p1 TRINITY_DN24213_c0_g1~~TRINITY_DN24213_c0_g1_i1.p1  ORF type:complete len:778 (+),score=214.48 TRINITY_DN24213_c0_g1_i1:48-2336(+)